MSAPPALRRLCPPLAAVVLAFAPASRAATYTAASCSAADVQGAVAAVSDGDVVLVPAGNCTWATVVSISVGLTLDGQCAANVTFASGGGLTVNADAVASTVVTGFTFNNGFTNGGFPITFNTTSAPFNAPFRLVDNNLNDDGQQGAPVTLIGVTGFGPGLIDHNTLSTANGADEVVHLLGSGDASDTSGWTNDVVPGGPNMIFLENNVFTNTSGTFSTSAEEAYYGAQMVFRYNALTFEGNDVHQGGLSGRWAEIYGNTYEIAAASSNLPDYWQFRGGSGLVYGNIASGTPCCQDPYPGAQFGPDCPSSDQCTGAWPIPTQVGTGINETTSSPVYVWGNGGTVGGATQTIQSSLSYTNGTQAGATPTGCTHAGGVCDVVATASAPSSWVRCESAADVAAGCPVTYTYAAYAYPHPLDDLPASCVGAGCSAGGSSGSGCGAGSSSSSGGSSTASSTASSTTTGRSTGTTGPASSSASASSGTSATSTTFATTSASRSSSATGSSTSSGSSGSSRPGSSGAASSSSSLASGSTGGVSSAAADGGNVASASGCGCSSGSAGEGALSMLLAVGLLAARTGRRPRFED